MDTLDLVYYVASIALVVASTVRVVEAKHIESVVISKALERIRRSRTTITPVQAVTRQPRHRAALLAPKHGDPNSARAICARITAELARQAEQASTLKQFQTELTKYDPNDTDRLYTHGFRGVLV